MRAPETSAGTGPSGDGLQPLAEDIISLINASRRITRTVPQAGRFYREYEDHAVSILMSAVDSDDLRVDYCGQPIYSCGALGSALIAQPHLFNEALEHLRRLLILDELASV